MSLRTEARIARLIDLARWSPRAAGALLLVTLAFPLVLIGAAGRRIGEPMLRLAARLWGV